MQSDPVGLDGGLNSYLYSLAGSLNGSDPLGLEVVGSWAKKPNYPSVDISLRRDNRKCTGVSLWDCKWRSVYAGVGIEVFFQVEASIEWQVSCFDTVDCESWSVSDSYYMVVDFEHTFANPVLCGLFVPTVNGVRARPMFHPRTCLIAGVFTAGGKVYELAREAVSPVFDYYHYLNSLGDEELAAICVAGRV